MIDIGYRFPHNGATVFGTAPADNDSIIVLCREAWGNGKVQWITGRVYLRQLPHPQEWHNGTYSSTIEDAVKHWTERSGLEVTEESIKYLSAFVRNHEKHLTEAPVSPKVAVRDGDNGPYADSTLTLPDGGTARVLLYRSPVVEHGVSVQVETDDLISHIGIMLNDGDLFAGNPEDPRNTFEVIRSAALAFLHGNDDKPTDTGYIDLKDLADALGVPYDHVEAIMAQDEEANDR